VKLLFVRKRGISRFPVLVARLFYWLSIFTAVFVGSRAFAAERLPENARSLIDRFCLDCHSGDDPEGDLDLEVDSISWSDANSTLLWERVHSALSKGEMPPSDSVQPSGKDRNELVDWLSRDLAKHVPVGGTWPRRLNRAEYQNTIRDLFDLSDFEVSDSFPADDSIEGFDNVGEGLILSPPLFAQFLAMATRVADQILPPLSAPKVAVSRDYNVGAAGLSTDKGGGAGLAGEHFRIASSRNMASAAGWPSRFEAPESGVYQFEIEVSPFQTDRMFYSRRSDPFELAIYARRNGEQYYDRFEDLREIARFEVSPSQDSNQSFSHRFELYQGEVFGVRWSNGPAYSDPPVREFSTNFLADRLLKDRRFYAAMLRVKGGPRGTTQSELYTLVEEARERGDLDLEDPRLDSLPKVWGGGLSDAPHNWIKTYVLEELHRFGPALDVLNVRIEGPVELVENEQARIRRERTGAFLGARAPGVSDSDFIETVLARILPRIFRRTVSKEELGSYVQLSLEQMARDQESRVDEGLHLALRRALVSPQFLYRSIRPGAFDDFDLASRLSYFLTSAPPDETLHALAEQGQLSDPRVLRSETTRLLADPKSQEFVRHFTGQWLGTRLLKDIMPDPRLLPFFDYDREMLIKETELLFATILSENMPVKALIDPGFGFRNKGLNKIYGGDIEGGEMRRVELGFGGRQGGILGLASVMMATANGVDTQPILRGVWLLENVLGMATPEPPSNVPAIASDTSGASTMRELLNLHRADASCARCHDLIDPLGMVMENFDPVGRWRDHYPIYTNPGVQPLDEEFYKNIGKGTFEGPRIDAKGRMPDGIELRDVTDLKRYVIERIDLFSRCLTEKLMVYGTGRRLGFGDRRVVDEVVEKAKGKGKGLRDLIVAIVDSESFRVK
jgi:hypothetical protein